MKRTSVIRVIALGVACCVAAMAQETVKPDTGLDPELKLSGRIEAGGRAIDTKVGHAAPFVGDFDGDGVKDLLVGQFGDGILWIFRNTGTNAAPALAAGVQFQQGAKDGRVPTG